MSFGYSIGDPVLLTQLAWKTVQNARKACGEHDELTQEISSLHAVLRRLKQEVEKPDNPLNGVHSGNSDKEELLVIVNGCQRVLSVLDQVLTKYNALGEQERSGKKLWQKIRFGNGKMADMVEMRDKLTYYTSAMSLFLNMVSMGSMGRVERRMNDAGGDLREIKVAVNGITALLMSRSNRNEGSILTAYGDDDRAVWKQFRRELLQEGFSSSVIRKHKSLIKAYIEELGSKGLFDEHHLDYDAEEQRCDVYSEPEEAAVHGLETDNDSDSSLRPKAEAESSVKSPSRPNLKIEPNTASHLKTEPSDMETPVDESIWGLGSRPKPNPEMRWIWLSSENGGGPQQSPANENKDPFELKNEDTRLFHDRWHEYHDSIAMQCILWFEALRRMKNDKIFHGRNLIDRISKARSKLANLNVLKSELMYDMVSTEVSLAKRMKDAFPCIWKDGIIESRPWTPEQLNFLGGDLLFEQRTGVRSARLSRPVAETYLDDDDKGDTLDEEVSSEGASMTTT